MDPPDDLSPTHVLDHHPGHAGWVHVSVEEERLDGRTVSTARLHFADRPEILELSSPELQHARARGDSSSPPHIIFHPTDADLTAANWFPVHYRDLHDPRLEANPSVDVIATITYPPSALPRVEVAYRQSLRR